MNCSAPLTSRLKVPTSHSASWRIRPEKEGSRLRSLQRPSLFISPGICPHHKEPHWRLFFNAVVDAPQIVIHPPQNQLVVIHRRCWTEFALAALLGVLRAVRPRPDDRSRRRILCPLPRRQQPVEIRRCPIRPVGFVIPAGKNSALRNAPVHIYCEAPPSPTRNPRAHA